MSEQWFLLEMGCAECGDAPLVIPRGIFDSERAARESVANERLRWIVHPSGGVFCQWGSGGYWAAPVSTIASADPTTEFGDKYDEAYRGL